MLQKILHTGFKIVRIKKVVQIGLNNAKEHYL